MKRKVVIYYPSKITGGAEFLLKNAADILKKEYEVTIFDVKNGWLSSNIKNVYSVTLSNNLKHELDENTVLITTANLVRSLDKVFIGDFKIIAWTVHPFNIIPTLPKVGNIQFKPCFKYIFKKTLLKPEYTRLNKLISYLNSKDSLYVMDDACNDVITNYFNVRVKNYLPVAIPNSKFTSPSLLNLPISKEINCVWLGRLDGSFKNPILIRTLSDTNDYAAINNQKIFFRIIGNGPGYDEIHTFSKALKSITVEFMLERQGEELKSILLNSDIGFAMGTSALEIAACNVPTILLDASYSKVSDLYRYKWLFEVKGYTLGRIIDASLDKKMGNNLTMSDVFSAIITHKTDLSKKSYTHVQDMHSESRLSDLLKSAIKNTTSNFNEMLSEGLTSKPFWHSLKKYYERFKK